MNGKVTRELIEARRARDRERTTPLTDEEHDTLVGTQEAVGSSIQALLDSQRRVRDNLGSDGQTRYYAKVYMGQFPADDEGTDMRDVYVVPSSTHNFLRTGGYVEAWNVFELSIYMAPPDAHPELQEGVFPNGWDYKDRMELNQYTLIEVRRQGQASLDAFSPLLYEVLQQISTNTPATTA